MIGWRTSHRSSLFPHTFSQGDEGKNIEAILTAVRGHRTFVVTPEGALPLMHDELSMPTTKFYVLGGTRPGR